MAEGTQGTGAVVVVDAMGGDDAPRVVLEGCAMALEADPTLKVLLAGPEEVVGPFCEQHDRVEPLFATQVIEMGDHPAKAVREKRDSSIVVGCKAVKEGRAAGFFSAGSTGACLAAATLHIGRIKGVMRPALASTLPSVGKPSVLVDVGANADWKPEYLVQFAQMGAVYARHAFGCESPSIALLNIGAEETKGSTAAQEAHALLREQVPGFAGNAEGSDLLAGRFDVVVTDGFTGNVALKSMEGTAKALIGELKKIFYSSLSTKIAGKIVSPKLKGLVKSMGSEAVGAAPLLGVRGAVMIGHGSSSAREVANGIAKTAAAVASDLTGSVAAAIGE